MTGDVLERVFGPDDGGPVVPLRHDRRWTHGPELLEVEVDGFFRIWAQREGDGE